MGGDQAPAVEVEGAVRAAREHDVEVILVGNEGAVQAELDRHDTEGLSITVAHASEVITMEDSAGKALRSKRDSSLHVASRLVREGRAHGLISAGNTGAIMVTSKVVMGVLPGVYRPALAQVFPTLEKTWTVLIDVGANVDCSPEMLAQFAIMGDVYSRVIHHREAPRVGLLSIGEEEQKGNEQTRGATPLLKQLPLNFVGNVEGRDLYSGSVDVIVCDGFIGNVALKVSEGLVRVVKTMLSESLEANSATFWYGKPSRIFANRSPARSATFWYGKPSRIFANRWTIPNTVVRPYWARKASALSVTAARIRTPSRTPSGWPPNSTRAASTTKSSKPSLTDSRVCAQPGRSPDGARR